MTAILRIFITEYTITDAVYRSPQTRRYPNARGRASNVRTVGEHSLYGNCARAPDPGNHADAAVTIDGRVVHEGFVRVVESDLGLIGVAWE